jgi:hypothetical protein
VLPGNSVKRRAADGQPIHVLTSLYADRPQEIRLKTQWSGCILFPAWGMCYNHRAVEGAGKPEPAKVVAGPDEVPPQGEPSRYCPVCSQPLEPLSCKLICPVCGYYMSCSDFH